MQPSRISAVNNRYCFSHVKSYVLLCKQTSCSCRPAPAVAAACGQGSHCRDIPQNCRNSCHAIAAIIITKTVPAASELNRVFGEVFTVCGGFMKRAVALCLLSL